jgi:uracil phosphoribosyltransferase
MSMSLRVIVPPHPLISHWLTILRNPTTPEILYATGLEQLGTWLTYEALRDWIPSKKEQITTSTGTTECSIIDPNIPILAIPYLPAGLELYRGARNLIPNSNLCIGGPPKEIEENAGIIFYIDQITTGKNLLKDLNYLKDKEIDSRRIRVITALAANQGLKEIGEYIQDLNIYCACIDPELISESELSPGIGDPSLRIKTRVTSSV